MPTLLGHPILPSLEEHFSHVVDLCHSSPSQAPNLYSTLSNNISNHISSTLFPRAKQDLLQNSSQFLPSFITLWADYSSRLSLLKDLHLYLDRTYVLQLGTIKPIWSLGMFHFSNIMIKNPKSDFFSKICLESNAILNEIRNSSFVFNTTSTLLEKTTKLVHSLSVYTEFEDSILNSTTQFYSLLGKQLVNQYSFPEFIEQISFYIENEHLLAKTFLRDESISKIDDIVCTQLVTVHLDSHFSSGFHTLLDSGLCKHISILYPLVKSVGKLDVLLTAFSQYIEQSGTTIISAVDDLNSIIPSLLLLKDKMDLILVSSIPTENSFFTTLKTSFTRFLKKKPHLLPQLIARYLDNLLRGKVLKTKVYSLQNTPPYSPIIGSEVDIKPEIQISKVMILFRVTEGHDEFQAWHQHFLSKRLLFSISNSEELEKLIISKLRQICGTSFVQKFEDMFKDIEISVDLLDNFTSDANIQSSMRKIFDQGDQGDVDFKINVITTSHWPSFPKDHIIVPRLISQLYSLFENFYCKIHPKKVLEQQASLSRAVISGSWGDVKRLFALNISQATLLLLFSNQPMLSFRKAGQLLGLVKNESLGSTDASNSDQGDRDADTDWPRLLNLFHRIVNSLASEDCGNLLISLDIPGKSQTQISKLLKANPHIHMTGAEIQQLWDDESQSSLDSSLVGKYLFINQKYSFKPKRHRISIKMPMGDSDHRRDISAFDRTAIKSSIDSFRHIALRAAIARVLKMKSPRSWPDLRTEVVSTMGNRYFFDDFDSDFKNVIQDLITSDVIKRDPTNRTTLHYVS